MLSRIREFEIKNLKKFVISSYRICNNKFRRNREKNSSITCNNKLHKQKEYFLFVISDSKSLQLILKFCQNGIFRILIAVYLRYYLRNHTGNHLNFCIRYSPKWAIQLINPPKMRIYGQIQYSLPTLTAVLQSCM